MKHLLHFFDWSTRQDPGKKEFIPLPLLKPTAKIGSNVYIGPYAYIGENCIIGMDVQFIRMFILVTIHRLGKIVLLIRE